jgi:hypothetical protein
VSGFSIPIPIAMAIAIESWSAEFDRIEDQGIGLGRHQEKAVDIEKSTDNC